MSGNELKKKRLYTGRIFMFTEKNDKRDCQDAKQIFLDFELDPSVISEIKIDSKPHLRTIMEVYTNKKTSTPQIFFNSVYFGGIAELLAEKNKSATTLLEKIKTTLNGEPGELYQVYKRQSEIFSIQPSDFYFPRNFLFF
jgi:glutaredoxin